jgi:hypothetical protein
VNKVTGLLLIVAAVCLSARAQGDNPQAQEPPAPEVRAMSLALQDRVALPAPTPGLKLVFEFPLATSGLPQTGTATGVPGRGESDRRTMDLPPALWVWKDGALYFDIGMFGNERLIPVPGGGASGCFGPILPERIEILRQSIEAFPPRPLPTTPSRR